MEQVKNRSKKFKIIFVCTDNIGRSIIAEYCAKDYLQKHKISNIQVMSAGTDSNSDISGFSMIHFDKLKEMGINASGHKRVQLTKEMANSADLIIAMDRFHQEWVKQKFGIEAPLFNQIYKKEDADIRVSPPGAAGAIDERMIKVFNYICDAIPVVIEKIEKEYI